MMSADIKKKKKEDVYTAEMSKASEVKSAEMPKSSTLITAKTMKEKEVPSAKAMKSSNITGAMLDKILGEDKEDVDAVTEVNGKVIKWKAGENPAEEESELKKRYKKLMMQQNKGK
jgi:hypothetical protein